MTNGHNEWNVKFSSISFCDRLLQQHSNISFVTRERDILFTFDRKQQGDRLHLLCLNEYTAGMGVVYRARGEFPILNIIYVGGNWNGYTEDAKVYCTGEHVGLFNSTEINGAIWKDEFWSYHRTDDEGNPWYPYRAP